MANRAETRLLPCAVPHRVRYGAATVRERCWVGKEGAAAFKNHCGVLAALLLLCLAPHAFAANPFAPLTGTEMRVATRLIRSFGRLSPNIRFAILTTAEPPKDLVLRGAAVPRKAFAVLYDARENRTWEAVANLSENRLEGLKEIEGAEPAIGYQDSEQVDRIVRDDSRWRRAMRERGITDLNNVEIVAWSAGYFALPDTDRGRIVRALTYYSGEGKNTDAHPVEGIVAEVNLTTRKIIEFLDTDRNAPVSRENFELNAASNRPWRTAPAPLTITQPQRGFEIDDNEVRWQKWHFRYALHPREGVVLYTVGYEDGGRVRSVLYRASLSEMVVPYGDPGGAWFFRNSFDAGELGMGINASSLRPGIDCPTNCYVYDAILADGAGVPHVIPGAVAIYERDAGMAWKHGEDARRARELVVSYVSTVGNYDYAFDWIFRQDGSLEMQVGLTGIMAVKGIASGQEDPYSHMVAKNIAAPHHQHFFSFRLDMDVDGAANRVVEMNTVSAPAGPRNPYRGAFLMKETPLRTEQEGERKLNLASSRRWVVENPSAKNALGHPVGYALLPGENAEPFGAADSWIRKRAGFLNAHIWVTPYDRSEMYAGGDYPNQSHGNDGLAKWAAMNRSIDDKDVVLWYTMGITHNPRPEDWPVMPVYNAGFRLVPWGFFTRNPALDLPPDRQGTPF